MFSGQKYCTMNRVKLVASLLFKKKKMAFLETTSKTEK